MTQLLNLFLISRKKKITPAVLTQFLFFFILFYNIQTNVIIVIQIMLVTETYLCTNFQQVSFSFLNPLLSVFNFVNTKK